MPILITTPKATNANAYVTVDEADDYIDNHRLYTSDWDAATGPTAEGYLVDSASPLSSGTTSIPVDTGTGTFKTGNKIKFGNHATEYTIASDYSGGAGTLTITSGLTQSVPDDASIERLSPNEKEKAIRWATFFLDRSFDWEGAKREEDQALRWPRVSVTDLDGDFLDEDTYPDLLKRATSELAHELIKENRIDLPDVVALGVRTAKVGPLNVDIDADRVQEFVPQHIILMLAPLGTLRSGASRKPRVAKVRRT